LAVLCYAVKQLISKVSDAGFDSLVRHVTTLDCFKCGSALEPVLRDNAGNQPYAGTTFISYGHYGSTVWDPPISEGNRRFLEINICDRCLVAGKDAVLHVDKIPQAPIYNHQPWNPEAE
jgi:hypothetical protein